MFSRRLNQKHVNYQARFELCAGGVLIVITLIDHVALGTRRTPRPPLAGTNKGDALTTDQEHHAHGRFVSPSANGGFFVLPLFGPVRRTNCT